MPDVGGSYILPRMAQPGLGLYCGLTGHRLNGTDCLKFGLATHFTPLAKFEALTNSLKSDDLSHGNAKKVLDNFHEQPTEPSSLDDEALAWIENVGDNVIFIVTKNFYFTFQFGSTPFFKTKHLKSRNLIFLIFFIFIDVFVFF